ncbi:LysR family transcriptional regulator [Herbaspirillum seropedicae]|uniref:LysR family transcriptional regulator n=1 Tax=Herbaspirillum seropedicae TaxID=964 RepID=UPI002866F639|nr:LysR family transcriptional regulator [Herbaspirillum seropedicae]MDR6396590.1 DNA-binding transcriptional LysR family regulator [Herbaspirillum seropedicae]
MSTNYDLAELRAFLEIASRGSFHDAAKKLNLSSSAISRRIASLEQALDTRLLNRSTRSVVLTDAGKNLYALAVPLIAALDYSVHDTVQQGLGLGGTLTLSAISTAAFSIVPQALAQFRKQFPNVRLHLHDDTGRHVLENVLARRVVFGVNTLTEMHADIFFEEVIQDPYVLVLPKDLLPSDEAIVDWRNLSTLIDTPIRLAGLGISSANRLQIDQTLKRHGVNIPWFDEVENLTAMLGLLRAGNTAAVMPRLALAACEEWGLTTVNLDNPMIARAIGLIRRHDTPLSTPAEAMWSLLRNTLLTYERTA